MSHFEYDTNPFSAPQLLTQIIIHLQFRTSRKYLQQQEKKLQNSTFSYPNEILLKDNELRLGIRS